MKKKITVVAALAALLMLTIASAALSELPEPEDVLTTDVAIKFKEAVYFVELGTGGMDFDFGEQLIPERDKTAYLNPISDNYHTLRVCDRRAMPGKWTIDAAVTAMASEDNSFIAGVTIYNPATTPGLIARLMGTTVKYIPIQPASRKIADAEADIAPGNYDLMLYPGGVQLIASAAEVEKVLPIAYTGTITWTLTLTP